MKTFFAVKLNYVLLACAFLLFSPELNAQNNNVQPKFKTVIVNIPPIKNVAFPKKNKKNIPVQQTNNDKIIIDSLTNIIAEYKAVYAKLLYQDILKDSIFSEANQRLVNLENEKKDLAKRLANYKVVNQQTEQSNRILIIFNSVVGVLLLFTLIWYLRSPRKKKTNSVVVVKPIGTAKLYSVNTESSVKIMNHSLEQLERLGKLREQGILTEEEFTRQKQVILETV